jgi:hypothetical protein
MSKRYYVSMEWQTVYHQAVIKDSEDDDQIVHPMFPDPFYSNMVAVIECCERMNREVEYERDKMKETAE